MKKGCGGVKKENEEENVQEMAALEERSDDLITIPCVLDYKPIECILDVCHPFAILSPSFRRPFAVLSPSFPFNSHLLPSRTVT